MIFCVIYQKLKLITGHGATTRLKMINQVCDKKKNIGNQKTSHLYFCHMSGICCKCYGNFVYNLLTTAGEPVVHNWFIKGRGMYCSVYGKVHIKDPLLIIEKSSLCGGSGFPSKKCVNVTI